jgi:rubrerythrin
MSSKRAIRRKACKGKARHADRHTAAAALFALNRNKGYQGPMNVYSCKFCGGWHIGHRPAHHP